MKRTLVFLVIISLPVLFTGCFQMKDISYAGEDSIDMDTGLERESSTVGSSNPGFKFFAGKISYQDDSTAAFDTPKMDGAVGGMNNKSQNNDIALKTSFNSLEEFDAYIQEIKRQSDIITEVVDKPGFSVAHVREAYGKSRALLDIITRIDIPEDIIRTERGRYYAGKYAVDELESIVVFRIELLEKYEKKLKKTSKLLDYEIKSLEEGAIPIKETAFEISRRSMMEEEGYIWDEKSKEFKAGQ